MDGRKYFAACDQLDFAGPSRFRCVAFSFLKIASQSYCRCSIDVDYWWHDKDLKKLLVTSWVMRDFRQNLRVYGLERSSLDCGFESKRYQIHLLFIWLAPKLGEYFAQRGWYL